MFANFIKSNLRGDKTIWLVYILLLTISIVEVYSASKSLIYTNYHGDISGPILDHIMRCFLGFVIVFFSQYIDFRKKWARTWSFIGYFLCLCALVLALVSGHATNDAQRWISICGFQLQPSEYTKIFFIFTTAFVLAGSDLAGKGFKETWRDKRFLSIMASTGVACILIGLENFSTAVIVGAVSVLMCLVHGVNWKNIGAVVAIVGTAAFVLIMFISPFLSNIHLFHRLGTMRARIVRFVPALSSEDDQKNVSKDTYQADWGKVAIANSRFIGRFPGNGEALNTLPQAFSDFIFASIIEELGVFGGVLVMALYIILLYRVGLLMAQSRTRFCVIMSAGLGLLIVTQATINMAVSVGMFPVTGQPLPLISRGGNSAMVLSAYFALLISFSYFENLDEKQEADAQSAGSDQTEDDSESE